MHLRDAERCSTKASFRTLYIRAKSHYTLPVLCQNGSRMVAKLCWRGDYSVMSVSRIGKLRSINTASQFNSPRLHHLVAGRERYPASRRCAG